MIYFSWLCPQDRSGGIRIYEPKKGPALSLLKGSVSLCRYRIIGGRPQPEARHNKNFLKYQARPVRLDKSSGEWAAGWVLPSGLSDPGERVGDYWDLSDCRIDGAYLLRLRLEKRKVPAELYQIMLQQKNSEFVLSQNRRPSRAEQQEIREEIKASLLAQALPVISYLDACWKDDGSVLLFHTAKKSREIFEQLFRSTVTKPMKASLIPISPPLMALNSTHWGEAEAAWPQLDRLERLLPAWIPGSAVE